MPILLPTAVSLLQRGILSYHPLLENRDVHDTDNSACAMGLSSTLLKAQTSSPLPVLLLLCPRVEHCLTHCTHLTIQLNSGL